VQPDPPHTNAFRVFVGAPPEALTEAAILRMENDQLALLARWQPTDVPGWAMAELTVGDATLSWDVDEQVAAVRALITTARG
jgi:hypothetical protein